MHSGCTLARASCGGINRVRDSIVHVEDMVTCRDVQVLLTTKEELFQTQKTEHTGRGSLTGNKINTI